MTSREAADLIRQDVRVTRSDLAAAKDFILQKLRGTEPFNRRLDVRDIAEERVSLGTLSIFDEAFANLGNTSLAFAVLHTVRVDKEGAEILQYLAESLADNSFTSERGRLLSEFVPLLAAPLQERGGATAIAALADEIEAFDTHFRNAVRRIDEPALARAASR